MTNVFEASALIIPVLLAITLHEAAHGYVADFLGDDTARRMGRISLNPLRHVDPFGTVLLPAFLFLANAPFLFGYAKPVPVNFRRLNNPRRDMVLVAAAGPGINLGLALASAVLFHGVEFPSNGVQAWLWTALTYSVYFNVLLAVFNMLPLPPLDGGRVAVGLLPDRLAFPLARLERHGILIVIGAIFLLPWLGQAIGVRLDVFQWLVAAPAQAVMRAILAIAGVN